MSDTMTISKCAFKPSSIDNTAGRAMYVSFLLWLISRNRVHGYELIKILKKEAGFIRIGPGHVYPLLGLLHQNGFIRVIEKKDGKRMKKLYTITSRGKKHLAMMRKVMFGQGLRKIFFQEMIF